MLELLISVIPLVLLCTSVGLVLINFDEVLSYLGFIAKQLITTPPVVQNRTSQVTNPTNGPNIPKTNQLPFFSTMVHRVITLFQVVFLPDFTIESPLPTKKIESNEPNMFNLAAEKQANSQAVKTYSQSETKKSDVPHTEVHLQSHFEDGALIHLWHIFRNIIFYLLLMIPFAIIGLVIMLYLNDAKQSGVSINLWLSQKIEELMKYINIQ